MPLVLPPPLEPYRAFLGRLERYFGVPGVSYVLSESTPDVASIPAQRTVLIGRKWRRAGRHEQEKRILHEMAHLWGLRHDDYARSIGYFSDPQRDRWSRAVYAHFRAGAARFDPAQFKVERYSHA